MQFSFKKLLAVAGIAFLSFIAWNLWQLFGPAPPIVVSKDTTYITAPLRPDGLPDYEKYILEKMREGVTPENNAAVLFWQAMGPGDDFDPGEFELMAHEIGLENIPAEDEVLQSVYGKQNRERIIAWLRQQDILPAANEEDDFERFGDAPWTDADDLAERMIDHALSYAWTSEQIPPLAEWVKANAKPLDLIVEASKRPRFYTPSTTLLSDTPEILIAMLLPGVQSARGAARALCARAMWHLGEGQPAEAWDDLHALIRFARLVGQGGTLVEQLVSIAIEGIAVNATLTLLDAPELPAELLRQIHSDLISLGQRGSMVDSIDSLERLCILDGLLTIRSGSAQGLGIDPAQAVFLSAAVDWNIPLRMLNEHYDEMVAAAKLPTWADRRDALEKHEQRLKQIEQSLQWQRAAGAILSRRSRSEAVGDVFTCLMLPATTHALTAQDRANTQLTLIQLAATIAVYRAEHGEYPDKIEDLVPGALDELSRDLFHDNSFSYRRTDDGYLLYSRGENGKDDGGSHFLWKRFHGYETDPEIIDEVKTLLGDELPKLPDPTKQPAARVDSTDNPLGDVIPSDADDIAIRVPLPKLELPKAK